MSKTITEITPLSEKDCFYMIDRYKDSFTYPIHKHSEFELNFVENCAGARRIVGDSIEELGNYDLALVGGGLEHVWEQHKCTSTDIREITIQFSADLLGESLLAKNQMSSLSRMFHDANSGIAFDMSVILRVYSKLDELTHIESGFYRVLKFLEILYELSTAKSGFRLLSSTSFAHTGARSDSRRVQKVEQYINEHYREEIRLQDLAEIVGMTATSFSRFFRLRTGKTVSDYLIDIRLGYASRALADSTMSVVEICYDSGFNNVSNFNRIFKKKKGCSPKVFRDNYRKNKTIT